LLKKETDNSVWSFTFPYPMYNSFQYFFTANVRSELADSTEALLDNLRLPA
jgi:hypothetical protein